MAQNPHVLACTLRFLAAVRLALPALVTFLKQPLSSAIAMIVLVCSSTAQSLDVLAPVVVSAVRAKSESITAESITVITRDEIERSGARYLAEILRTRSGIQVADFFGDGSRAVVDMRGFGPTAASNTLIMVDGRRLNNNDIAAADINSVLLAAIERIEIVEGSAGALFGDQAVGGVINIITRTPTRFDAYIDASGGSYDSWRVQGSVSDRLNEMLSYRLSADKRQSDNYRDNNDADYTNVAGRMDLDYATGRLFAEYQYVDDELRTPGALFADELEANRRQVVPGFENDFSNTQTHVARIGVRQDLSHHWSLEGEYTYRNADGDFQLSFRNFPGSPSTQDRDVQTFNPRLVGSYGSKRGEAKLTFGADLEWSKYKLDSSIGLQKNDQELYGVYLQGVMPLTERFSVTAAVRHARADSFITDDVKFPNGQGIDDGVTVGALGILFRPNAHWRLFARVDQNFRFPKVDEFTSTLSGVTVLDTQTGISYELGAQWSRDPFRAKITLYHLDLDDEIVFDTVAFANVNVDSSSRNGVIVEGRAALLPGLELGLNYGYVDADIDSGSLTGKRIPLVADHTVLVYADYDISSHWHVYAELKALSERVLSGDFSNDFDPLPGYGIVNAQADYHVGGWTLSARVNNLLDKAYSDNGATGFDRNSQLRDAFFPAPALNFWFTARYDFG